MSAVLTISPPESAPLDQSQLQALQRLLESCDQQQITWLSGYLAGISWGGRTPAKPAAATSPAVLIIHASQTGNAVRVAKKLEASLGNAGVRAEIRDVRRVNAARLKSVERVIVIASTYGEGEPPDAAQIFHRELMGARAPRVDGLEFAVLALGDRGYDQFCKTGRDFDERLEALGGKRITERIDCDVDFEASADRWITNLTHTLGHARSNGAVVQLPGFAGFTSYRSTPRSESVSASIRLNQKITGRRSTKDVRHIELELEDASFLHEPGDSVSVAAANDAALVQDVLQALRLDADEEIEVSHEKVLLAEALRRRFDLTVITRPLVERYAEITGSAELRRLLADEAREDFRRFVAGRDLLDVITAFPPQTLSGGELVSLLRKLPRRSYSIASSALASPGEVQLTVGVVSYESMGRTRKGVASSFLAELQPDDAIELRLESNPNFRLPVDDATPIIMIGAGTGAAPYRAFLQERDERGAWGPTWLIFGDRNFRSDFLYQTDWLDFRERNVLSRLDVAFSRDGAEKVYVQHRIREQATELHRWIADGAHVYVCGDANHMARDVQDALVEVLARGLGADTERAREHLESLGQEGRYQRDVY